MKKNIIYCFATLVMVVSLLGCNKNEDDVINFEATTNATEKGEGEYSVKIDETILFTDWSTGVVSRTWTFPGGTPATSTDEEVSVTFAEAATVTCTLDVVFSDGTTNTKGFVILVGDGGGSNNTGSEGYSNRDVFSFENETAALASWSAWSPEATYPATLTVDASQGANGTSSSGKVSFTATGKEIQFFTNQDYTGINAKMDKSKLYEFSFWAKASATTTITAALENSVDITKHTWATENQAWTGYLWQDKEIGTEWVKYSFTIDPSNQEYNTAENVYIKIKMVPSELVDIWLDEFSLRELVYGNEEYTNRNIFSYENETAALASWSAWSPEATYPATLTVDASQGANGTSSSGKVSFTATGKEIQFFTNQDYTGINAKMDKSKLYEFSFWAKASATTTITAALENSVDITKHTWAAENQAWTGYLWQDQELGTEWVKYSFTIDPSAQAYDTAENVYIKIKIVPIELVDIWLDDFSLKEKIIL